MRVLACGVVASIVALSCAHRSDRTSSSETGLRAAALERSTVPAAASVAVTCNLPQRPTEQPLFAFDSAQLLDGDKPMLDSLARCLTVGPLERARIVVTGYADPRGPVRYNADLGLARAWATKLHLESAGVSQDRVDVRSRGERDAQGTDSATWVLDRRVDIDLAR